MEFEVGLLGAGFIASFHAEALARIPGVRVTAVCDADKKKAAALAATIPGAKVVGSLEALLAEKPDVVHVLLPPASHAKAAVDCLAGGAHVFVEKPLATSTREIRAIAAAAQAMSRQVGVNHNVPFNATFRVLVDAIRAKKLGELEHVSLTWNVPLRQLTSQPGHWMFQAPGNILLEQAVHPLSMAQFLLGDLVKASVVHSSPHTLPNGQTFHRTWQVSLVLERGTAQLLLSFGREFSEIGVFAIGQDGSAALDLRRNTFALRGNSFQEPPLDDLAAGFGEGIGVATQAVSNFARTLFGTVKLAPAFSPFSDSIRDSVQSFYSALAAGKEPLMGLARGRAVVEMCEALVSPVQSVSQPSLESTS